MRYRGRLFSEEEIQIIKRLIEEAPSPKHRRPLSKKICEALNWVNPFGGLKDMACRVALLQMVKDGIIQLPQAVSINANKFKIDYSKEPAPELTVLECPIQEIKLEITLVDKTTAKIWNTYVEHYHYLGYTKLGGAQLRYIVSCNGKPIIFFGFSAAAWKVKDRDDFIGWTPLQKEKKLHLIINNSRYLILPTVKVPHLASHALAKIIQRLKKDWYNSYKYKPALIETFVQKDRFAGTAYKAANWKYLGDTQGRGKYDRYAKKSVPVKTIWVYPLEKNYKNILAK